MSRNPALIIVSVVLALLIIVAAAVSGDDSSGDLPVGPVTPALDVPGATEAGQNETPSAHDDEIYKAVEEALASPDNPANREIPEDFLGSDRDEEAFQEWTLEMLNLGIEFQQTVFKDVGRKFGMNPDKVAEIHITVRDWRQANSVPLD